MFFLSKTGKKSGKENKFTIGPKFFSFDKDTPLTNGYNPFN